MNLLARCGALPLSQGAHGKGRRRATVLVLGVALAIGLSACGKKGLPSPPGPPDKVIYPRFYPAE